MIAKLFSIYINDLPFSTKASCQMFADDTTVYVKHTDVSKISTLLQPEVDKLIEWAELNHMVIHPQKTKYMLVTNRQKRQNLCVDDTQMQVVIAGKNIDKVDSHKVLGVIIDHNLSWTNHIDALCKKVSKYMFQLTRMKHFLDIHSRKLYFIAYIQSSIDYSSTIWDSASYNSLKPLVSLYKRGLKLILSKCSSLTIDDYKCLEFLPLKEKLLYNKAIFMYKILSGSAPIALTELFYINKYRHRQHISIPRPRLDLYKSSLAYSGGYLYNSLPETLKNQPNLQKFKKAMYLYLRSQVKLASIR